MVYQLIYLSYIVDGLDALKLTDEVLETARKRNPDLDITGVLIYRNEFFVQLLEGDKEKVLSLFGKIASDPRHYNLSVLARQEVSERLFSDWSMGFKDLSKFDHESVNKLLELNALQERCRKGELLTNIQILDMFKKFRYEKLAS